MGNNMDGVFDEYAKRRLLKDVGEEKDKIITKLCAGNIDDIKDYRYLAGALKALDAAADIIKNAFIDMNSGSDEDEEINNRE